MLACDVLFRRVSLNSITLPEKKRGKGEKKRKNADTPFIARFLNYRLFLLFPRLFIVCDTNENAHAVCVCPILLFISGEFILLKGERRRRRRPTEEEKNEEKKSVILPGKSSNSRQIRSARIVLSIRLINNVL